MSKIPIAYYNDSKENMIEEMYRNKFGYFHFQKPPKAKISQGKNGTIQPEK